MISTRRKGSKYSDACTGGTECPGVVAVGHAEGGGVLGRRRRRGDGARAGLLETGGDGHRALVVALRLVRGFVVVVVVLGES